MSSGEEDGVVTLESCGLRQLSGPSSSARALTPLDAKNQKNIGVATRRWAMLYCKRSSQQAAGQCSLYTHSNKRPPAN